MTIQQQLDRILELESEAGTPYNPDLTNCGFGIEEFMEASTLFAPKAARALKPLIDKIERARNCCSNAVLMDERSARQMAESAVDILQQCLDHITKELES